MQAFEQELPLLDLLSVDNRVTAHFSTSDLADMLQPERYVGLCGLFVDQVTVT
jgi:hypothetical protein